MSERTIIPFGPQHPVLPEPIHLDLVVEDEKVIEAIPSIGFIHRGLERLVEKKDYVDYVYVAERICGICSFIHGLTYCMAIEELMKVQVPDRAQYLRLIWSELSRIHSHLLWLGLTADSFGFESMFMQSWRLREYILDIIEETTGGRVIFGSAKIGGVRRDIPLAKMDEIMKKMRVYRKDVAALCEQFMKDQTVKHRMRGVGLLSREDAISLGAVGPMLRGSGVAQDIRMTGYSGYDRIGFTPITETAGDCYARCMVRVREMDASFQMIERCVEQMTDGPIEVKVTGNPNGEFFMRSEQPRGEAIYYAKANGTKFLSRLRVRTPTFANIPPLLTALAGCQLADVPVIVLTIDPCISCAER
ncbi:MAG: nickel-dependent hydrogenase large subunit [Candidatus Omnitrophica bacterium]|nr:nickel-dependent hydrogenase large subunit [Candidatus Omnitrophota bacterium]